MAADGNQGGTRRWELTDAERERLEGSRSRVGSLEVARALLAKPKLIPRTVRSALRGASAGLRGDPALGWYLTTRRMRRQAPEVATGATWHGAEEFAAAVEPHLEPSMRALEIGCGAGRVSRLIAPHVGELICTDLSAPMLEEAAENLAEFDRVSFELAAAGDLEGLGLGPLDLVFAHNVLVTFDPDPAIATLDTMARLLRPGGICAVSFLTIDEEAWAREALEEIRKIGPDGHFGATHARPYVSAQADAMVKLAGFELLVNRHGDPARDTGQPHYNVVGRLPDEKT